MVNNIALIETVVQPWIPDHDFVVSGMTDGFPQLKDFLSVLCELCERQHLPHL